MPLYRGTRYPLLRGAPSFITLSGTSVPEDAGAGTLIGTLAVANGQGGYAFSIASDPDLQVPDRRRPQRRAADGGGVGLRDE